MTVRAGPSIVYTEQYDQATPIVTNTGFAIIGPLGILFPTDAAYRLRDGLPPVITPIEADLVPGFGVAFGTSALNQILGGWTISTIIEARTGLSFFRLLRQCQSGLPHRRTCESRYQRTSQCEFNLAG